MLLSALGFQAPVVSTPPVNGPILALGTTIIYTAAIEGNAAMSSRSGWIWPGSETGVEASFARANIRGRRISTCSVHRLEPCLLDPRGKPRSAFALRSRPPAGGPSGYTVPSEGTASSQPHSGQPGLGPPTRCPWPRRDARASARRSSLSPTVLTADEERIGAYVGPMWPQ